MPYLRRRRIVMRKRRMPHRRYSKYGFGFRRRSMFARPELKFFTMTPDTGGKANYNDLDPLGSIVNMATGSLNDATIASGQGPLGGCPIGTGTAANQRVGKSMIVKSWHLKGCFTLGASRYATNQPIFPPAQTTAHIWVVLDRCPSQLDAGGSTVFDNPITGGAYPTDQAFQNLNWTRRFKVLRHERCVIRPVAGVGYKVVTTTGSAIAGDASFCVPFDVRIVFKKGLKVDFATTDTAGTLVERNNLCLFMALGNNPNLGSDYTSSTSYNWAVFPTYRIRVRFTDV